MKKKMPPSHKSTAQAMVEFALILPVLLLLVYGMLEVGRLLFIYSSVVSAARQAVRYGATTGVNAAGTFRYRDCAGMRDAAQRVGFIDNFEDTDIEIWHDEGEGVNQVSYCPAGQAANTTFTPSIGNLSRIRVRVHTQYTPIVPLVPLQPFVIESISARTILVSVAIIITAAPLPWDPDATPIPPNTPIPPPPADFSKLSPDNDAVEQATSVTLTWEPSADATSYEVCYYAEGDTCSWMGNGTSTSYPLSNLATSTTYYWHVRARNATGITYSNGADTAFWTFTTSTPLPPGAFSKTSPGNGAANQATSVTLTWSASTGATSYEGCYDTTNDNACSSWVNIGLSTSHPLSNLATSTTYYWHVRALNTTGTTYSNGGFWSFTTAALPPPPAAFHKTSPSNNAIDQETILTLTWEASSGANEYEYCYYAEGGTCSWISNGFSTSKEISNLITSTTYYWHVRALNDNPTITYSDSSSAAFWSFTTIAPPPACSISASALSINPTNQTQVSMTLHNDAVSIITAHIQRIVVNFNNSGGNGIQGFSIIPDLIWNGNQTSSPLTINVGNPYDIKFTFAPNVSKTLTATFKKAYAFSAGNSFVISFVEPECGQITVDQNHGWPP